MLNTQRLFIVSTLILCSCGVNAARTLTKEEYTEIKRDILAEYGKYPGIHFLASDYTKRLREAERVVPRKICRQHGVSYETFSEAHRLFGRQGLTYRQERVAFFQIMPGNLVDSGLDVDVWGREKLLPVRNTYVDSIEQVCRLGFDMGMPIPEAMILIQIDLAGTVIPFEETIPIPPDSVSPDSFTRINAMLDYDPYLQLHIMPHPGVPVESIFKTIRRFPEACRINISDMFEQHQSSDFVKLVPDGDTSLLRTLADSGLCVFIQVPEPGVWILNSDKVSDPGILLERIYYLLRVSPMDDVVIVPSGQVQSSSLIELIRQAYLYGSSTRYIINSDHIKGFEPYINTDSCFTQFLVRHDSLGSFQTNPQISKDYSGLSTEELISQAKLVIHNFDNLFS